MGVIDVVEQWRQYPAFHDRVLSIIGIEVHWAVLQYVLGLSFLSFIAYLIYMRTNDEKWRKLSYTLFKGFVIVFAVGAATGTASEFGLVLLWPNVTEAAGRYIYFPLYAEVFAFIMEIVFIYLTYYAWRKFGRRALAVLLLLSFVGPWYSAAMILSVNSYMVAPTGIVPAYDVKTGHWLYDQGYPKVTVVVPNDIAGALNVTALQAVGASIVGQADNGVIVQLPSRVVQRLVYEAWRGYKVKDSILAAVISTTYLQGSGSGSELLNAPVKAVLDQVLVNTVMYVGPTMVTFKSPVYLATLFHSIGAALTVSIFTVLAAYTIRLVQTRNTSDEEYKEYVKAAFKFSAVAALVIIAVQGFVSGHEMGRAIAEYNPEKFAAIEATTNKIFRVTSLLPGGEKLPALLAYGDPNAPLPDYDAIPDDYCACILHEQEDMARIGSCKPPLIIHYMYYTKIGLGILLGLYALAITYYLWRLRDPEKLQSTFLGKWLLGIPQAVAVIFIVHLVSFLGWGVREIGRKPWTIYGVMTTDVAHTANPASPGAVALVAAFFLAMLGALAYSVYRFLWVPGLPREGEA
ncbi:hypothetical protein JCM10135_10260 [Stetteria hydrogenophila]